MKKSRVLGLVITALVLALAFGASGVWADEDPNSAEFTIDGTTISGTIKLVNPNADNSALVEPIDKDAPVRILIDFTVDNIGDATGFFTVQLPKEIVSPVTAGQKVYVNDDMTKPLGEWEIDSEGILTFTFDAWAATQSNVGGNITITSLFDEEEIDNSHPDSITFEVKGVGVVVPVEFEQPPATDAKISKNGIYDTSGLVVWTVTVDPGNRTRTDVIIKDILGANQTYGSIIEGGTGIAVDQTGGLTFTIAEIEEDTPRTFKFTTQPDTAAFDEGSVDNEVELHFGEITEDPVSEDDASVPLIIDWITKDGRYNTYDHAHQQITWTVTINGDGRTLVDPVITDIWTPTRLVLDQASFVLLRADGEDLEEGITHGLVEGSVTTGGFQYKITGTITEAYELTFITSVPIADYQKNTKTTYTNTAALSWNGQTITPPSDSKGVGVGKSLISKDGDGYNPATQEITWKIVVNSNLISLTDPVVTEYIHEGQTYKTGSFKIKEVGASTNYTAGGEPTYTAATSDAPITYPASGETTQNMSGKLVYTFGPENTTINKAYEITFITTVNDPEHYGENETETYHNIATLTALGKVFEAKGTQEVKSTVISKTGTKYDYANRIITWQIKVNQNKMPMTAAKLTDYIPKGQKYEAGSFAVKNSLGADVYDANDLTYTDMTETNGSHTLPDGTAVATSGQLEYDLGDINETYTITYQTKITDLSIFLTNGAKTLYNYAQLAHQVGSKTITQPVTGTISVENTVIGKEAIDTDNKSYVDWELIINSNRLTLAAIEISDTLPEGLELDTDSIKLQKLTQDADGALTVAAEDEEGIPLTAANVDYDYEKREFVFRIPGEITDAHKLTFKTYIVGQPADGTFTNTATLKSTFGVTAVDQGGTGNQSGIRYFEFGSSGYGETGSITITKIDKHSPETVIEGAVFVLTGTDPYNNERVEEKTTDEHGKVVFNRLKYLRDYTITEKTPAPGYLKANIEETFQITGIIDENGDDKNIFRTFENIKESNAADIELSKQTAGGQPLGGAEFTIYYAVDGAPVLDAAGNPVPVLDAAGNPMVAISTEEGVILFKDIEVGDYIVRETKAPGGFIKSNKEIKVTITPSNGGGPANVAYDPNDTVITNERIPNTPLGEIRIMKEDEDGKPLSGAKFKLEDSDGRIRTATSNSSGVARFTYLPYGRYTLWEDEAPKGYQLDDQEINLRVNSENVIRYTFVNTKAEEEVLGRIELRKTDQATGAALSGAEFTLYDEQGKKIAAATSNAAGLVRFEDVLAGKYTVMETRAPEGYVLSTERIHVTVDSEQAYSFTFTNTLINTQQISGSVRITKIDEANAPLAGATFTLYNANGVAVATAQSGSDGVVRFDNLLAGLYTVSESQAPSGYQLVSGSKTVSVSAAGTQHFAFRNLPEGFDIGDEDIPAGWIDISDPNAPSGGLLPQAGGLLDTALLVALGGALMLAGMALLRLRRSRG